MKALMWLKENLIEIKDIEIPEIGKNEVLIKVRYAGICGSDITVMRGKHVSARPPVVLGHEFSGTVERTGSGFFNIGDRVVVEPLIYCGRCEACISGHTHVCKYLRLFGIHENGGFAEFVKVPENAVFSLPGNLSLIEGALVEPLSVAVHSIDMSEMKFGSNILVTGAGPIGILCGILAIYYGANNVMITDISSSRLDIARKFGITCINSTENNDIKNFVNVITNNCGADVVFECTGIPEVINVALQNLAIKGTLVQVGIGKKNVDVDFKPIAYKEQKIIGVRVYAKVDFQRSINFLASKKVNLQDIVTQIFELKDIKKAFEISEDKEKSLKILIKI